MLPKDPNILLSVINMKLRDFYPSLNDLCADTGESREDIEAVLLGAGWEYDSKTNSFQKKEAAK